METPSKAVLKKEKREETGDKHTEYVQKNFERINMKRGERQTSSVVNVVEALNSTASMVREQMNLQRQSETQRFDQQMQYLYEERERATQRFEIMREADRAQRESEARRFELLVRMVMKGDNKTPSDNV